MRSATPWSRDAVGKAVPAGVAEQPLPEPYLPGSGDRVPAELRLVLAGYAGIACGLFAGALACAAAFVFLFLIAADIDPDVNKYLRLPRSLSWLSGRSGRCCSVLAVAAFLVWGFCGGLDRGCEGRSRAQGAYPVFQAAPAAQRSTHGHGDGLEAWRTHTDTRHHPRRVPAPVRGSPRVVDEGRHARAR